MNKYHKIMSGGLIILMSALVPAQAALAAPSFAHTQEEWDRLRDNVLEYDELEALIHEYNPTVRNNQSEYGDYFDATRKDVSDMYWELALDLYESVNYPDEDASNYPVLYANARMAEIQASQYKQQALNNLDDGTTKLYGYEQAEARLVSNAQSYMVSYHQSLLQLEQAKENRKLAEETYNSVQIKADNGAATQAELLSAKQSVLSIDASISSLERTITNTRQKLCLMTGWSYDAQPEIREIPDFDFGRIEAIYVEADKTKALESNYTLLIDERKLKYANDTVSRETLTTTINDNRQKITSDIDIAYNAVLQAQVAYEQADAELSVETKNMEMAERKYQTGGISRLEYISQESAYITKQINKKLKNLELHQAMETYDWNIKGLGTSV